jgi:Photosynthesis system II assembly factor YCF48
MQNVPKIVRERLKVPTPAVNHPDADVLTAFSERSLPELERDIVLEHLARCGECREVVALALPASEAVQIAPSPSSSGWLAWPTLRWAFVAAGIIVVSSLGVLRYQRQSRSSTMAYKVPAAAVADTEAQNQPVPTPAAPKAAEERDKAEVPSRLVSRNEDQKASKHDTSSGSARPDVSNAPVIPSSTGANAVHGALAYGPRLANQQLQQNSNLAFQTQAPAAAPPPLVRQRRGDEVSANAQVPAASQMAAVQSESVQVASPAQNQDALVLRSKSIPLQPLDGGSAETTVSQAEPGTTVLKGSVKLPGGTAPSEVAGAIARAPNTSWTISSDGGLQRSFDQGTTWQDVNVTSNNSVGGAVGGPKLDVAAKASPVKAKDAAVTFKKEVVAPTFRAVAANGADVWAGGSAGLLYHSTDAGANWSRVVPAASGAILAGDVIALDFPDPQHGRISTSTAEVWITADAGQTWQKQ